MNDYTLTEQSVKKIARLIKTGDRPKYQPPIVPSQSRRVRSEPSEGIKYFVLAADATSCPVWAYRARMQNDGTIVANDPAETFELYFHNQLLSAPKVARAGYSGQYGLDDEGRDSFLGNPCIISCTTSAVINPSSLPNSTVGAAYTGTVSVSGLNATGVTATNLPPGLTINSTTGAVTGTPTTAGEYVAIFSGADSGGCRSSVAKKITITETA